jgi:hypothetical protein
MLQGSRDGRFSTFVPGIAIIRMSARKVHVLCSGRSRALINQVCQHVLVLDSGLFDSGSCATPVVPELGAGK